MPGWWHRDRLPRQPALGSAESAASAVPVPGVPDVRQDIKTAKGPVQGTGQQNNSYYYFLGPRLSALDDPNMTELIPDLTGLLERVPGIRSLIYDVASRQGIQFESGDHDLRTLLDRLSDAFVSRDQFPLLLEVARLAIGRAGDPALHHDLAAIIRRWAQKAADGPTQLNTVSDLRQSPEAAQNEPYLMIKLEREKNGDARYRLSVAMFRGRTVLDKKEETQYVSLERNREHLKKILPGLVDTVDRSRLSVEFIVDRDLLNEEFDQWKVPEDVPDSPPDQASAPSGASDYPIGVAYQVVVRDLQRMMKPSLHGWWQSKWQALSTGGADPGATRWCWIDPVHDAGEKLYASLLWKDQMACLALVSAPCFRSDAAKLLETGLTVGAPAAIWLRASPGEGQARALLEALLDNQELCDLPARVLALRREAAAVGTDDHHGRQLSLLWDDPNRVWLLTPLTEP